MLFNSLSFAIFLPIVFLTYWSLSQKYRWVILLISSYYFYMSWNAKYVVLILFTTVISFVAGRLMENVDKQSKKKILLLGTLVASLGVLFFFKYLNFISSSIWDFLELFSIHISPFTLKLLLPVGISFYTFQTLSYVIDVYNGEIKPEHHFGRYATFISFFPQLVAGPIERAGNLMPQIAQEQKFDYKTATLGLKYMAWGFFKKMVIADNLAIYVDSVFDSVYKFKGFSLILATVFFSFQIYCDFSGYSDIAIGTAKLFGINLMTNFKSPYLSASVKEFWSRWHISLSTWFRDYVYIPLGGNRVSNVRQKINVMITFLVSGLWHGANWTYVVWGGIHGVAQIIEDCITKRKPDKQSGIFRLLKIPVVFIFCCFAWVFFRAKNITEAIYVMNNSLFGIRTPLNYLITGFRDISVFVNLKVSHALA